MTETKSFGTGKREGHDASKFYSSRMYDNLRQASVEKKFAVFDKPKVGWTNQVHCLDGVHFPVPDGSIALTFTSPPYNVGKEYDANYSYEEYLEFMRSFIRVTYKKTMSGGKFVINVAGIGRKPYISLSTMMYNLFVEEGWLPIGEIVWVKAQGASGSCAWGSWKSAKNPVLRDLHEYLLVFTKDTYGRIDKGKSTISKEDFMRDTLSTWYVQPASAKRYKHPAPFPVELARRVINLYSYAGDVIFDPFCGVGTTCVAAKELGRYYVGIDNVEEYIRLAKDYLENGGLK